MKPQRIFDGIMINKPTLLRDGTWLAPAAIWSCFQPGFIVRDDMRTLRFSNAYASANQGQSWNLVGQADVRARHFDEHMIVERRDGSLWMLVRTYPGIGEAVSLDGGKTWAASKENILDGPDARFFIRRLRSGRLLLKTWYGHFILDERSDVSYPDGIETSDGMCYVIYDRERTKAKEILLAKFTETDVEAGKPTTEACRLKQLVSKVPSI